MTNVHPLLLLDNNSMMSVINEGEFKSSHLSFEEAKVILNSYEPEEMIRCFHHHDIETILFDYLGIGGFHLPYQRVRDMHPGQDALVFKVYIEPSHTTPLVRLDEGYEAKKVQNVYAHCLYLSRIK